MHSSLMDPIPPANQSVNLSDKTLRARGKRWALKKWRRFWEVVDEFARFLNTPFTAYSILLLWAAGHGSSWFAEVTWMTVTLLGILGLPLLLPLVAKHVAEVGPLKTRDTKRGDQIDASVPPPKRPPQSAPEADAAPPAPEEDAALAPAGTNRSPAVTCRLPVEFDLDAKEVLETLWHFQLGHDPSFTSRWGYGRARQIDGEYFVAAELVVKAQPLFREGLVILDARGMVFLTASGIDYCQSHPDLHKDASSFRHLKFAPAP